MNDQSITTLRFTLRRGKTSLAVGNFAEVLQAADREILFQNGPVDADGPKLTIRDHLEAKDMTIDEARVARAVLHHA